MLGWPWPLDGRLGPCCCLVWDAFTFVLGCRIQDVLSPPVEAQGVRMQDSGFWAKGLAWGAGNRTGNQHEKP